MREWLRWFVYGVVLSVGASFVLWIVNYAWTFTAGLQTPKAITILTGSIGLFILYIALGIFGVIKHFKKRP